MSSPLYGGGQEDFSYQVEQCLSAIYSISVKSVFGCCKHGCAGSRKSVIRKFIVIHGFPHFKLRSIVFLVILTGKTKYAHISISSVGLAIPIDGRRRDYGAHGKIAFHKAWCSPKPSS